MAGGHWTSARGAAGGLLRLAGTVYGVSLRGHLPGSFGPYLLPPVVGGSAPDRLELDFRDLGELPDVDEIWAQGEAGGPEGRIALFNGPAGFGLIVEGAERGVFRCSTHAVRIEWGTAAGAAYYFFSYALPLWLESRGAPVLHASAVGRGGRAVGFLGASGAGKSVLAAELGRRGYRPLADDGLVLRRSASGEWRSFEGPPLLRLWPSGLERLRLPADPLPRVHETLDKRHLPIDGAAEGPPPDGLRLAALYLLERLPPGSGGVRRDRLSPREALVRLLAHGVAAAPAAALGLAPRRLELLAAVAESVAVWRLRFPGAAADTAASIDRILADELA